MNVLARDTVAVAAAAVSLRGIGKTYVNGELAVEVLKDISLDIAPGEFVAIIGQSGSGKSTLMNILGCLDQPTAGTYRLNGIDVAEMSRDELAHLRRDTFGFVFQSYNLIATLDATENVELPATYSGLPKDERRDRAEELLTRLGLGDRMEHKPNQLSGGQQQRVALARSLAVQPEVLLLDEPFSALDAVTRRALQRDVRRIAVEYGITLVIVTHDIPEAVAMADRALVMASDPGRIVESVPIEVNRNDRDRRAADTQVAQGRLQTAFENSVGRTTAAPPARPAQDSLKIVGGHV
ncbi:MAG: ABC transporter ATP-binding protein [Bradyrhizobium sp.]|nr:ABC transporter ATP-binding protein [Bradyrhizobium sp.]